MLKRRRKSHSKRHVRVGTIRKGWAKTARGWTKVHATDPAGQTAQKHSPDDPMTCPHCGLSCVRGQATGPDNLCPRCDTPMEDEA